MLIYTVEQHTNVTSVKKSALNQDVSQVHMFTHTGEKPHKYDISKK